MIFSPRKKEISISLPSPCHEKWEDMTKTEHGRYCGQCTKEVIDFTRFTDDEMVSFFFRNRENVCGQFRATQLNRPIIKETTYRMPYLNKTLAFLGILGAGIKAQGQDSNTKFESKQEVVQPSAVDKNIEPDSLPKTEKTITIRGTVVDSTTHEPLDYAIISVKETSYELFTDEYGNFIFKIPDSLANSHITIFVQYFNYTQSFIIRPEDFAKPILAITNFINTESQLNGAPIVAKRKWWKFWKPKY
ncbi:MAG: carboxypeptidase-like regulatory domain-containing protein [Flavobacteriales bacterium]|nr:carboxypeptidase-like regulatory domain-containing protein [Flavobacteriales bacterium]